MKKTFLILSALVFGVVASSCNSNNSTEGTDDNVSETIDGDSTIQSELDEADQMLEEMMQEDEEGAAADSSASDSTATEEHVEVTEPAEGH